LQILKGAPIVEGRPGATLPHIDFVKLKSDLIEKHGDQIKDVDVMSSAMYPKVFDEYAEFVKKYGPVDKLDTRTFFAGPEIAHEINVEIEKGKTLHVITLAKGDLMKTGEREVFFELNGQMRSVMVKDNEAMKEIHVHPKALKGVRGSVGAPMPGEVLEIKVKVGDKIEKGQQLAILSAMKMEMVVQSPLAGVIKSISAAKGMKLEGDDLLMDIE
jgi:pyruvate carboxylase